MQITDEMIEAVESAQFNATTDFAKAAITTVYPLIRKQVLEEARNMIHYEAAFMNKDGLDAAHRFTEKLKQMAGEQSK